MSEGAVKKYLILHVSKPLLPYVNGQAGHQRLADYVLKGKFGWPLLFFWPLSENYLLHFQMIIFKIFI